MNIVEETKCRICKGSLEEVFTIGSIFPSSFLKDDEKLSEDQKAPLVLAQCKNCGLVQLKHTVDLDSMYRQYWYSSSLNKSMVSSLRDVVADVESKITLVDGDTVIDIGCNDGTMLDLYSNKNLYTIGFDPALNLEKPKCLYFYNDYFSSDGYFDLKGQTKAKVITAIAMFYDLPDPNKFVEDVKAILHDDGIFVVQFTDLISMFKATAFDNICHEHLEYYRLQDVINLLMSHGLDVIDVSYNDVNGGSLRVTACHDGRYTKTANVFKFFSKEKEFLKNFGFDDFKVNLAIQMVEMFKFIKGDGKEKTFVMGASTKGNTFLQTYGITNEMIPFAAEVNKEKFGLRTAGSNIKIISEDEAFEMNPEYFLVLPWHFEKSLVTKERIRNYINNGGKLVFPLPVFHIVGKENLKDE